MKDKDYQVVLQAQADAAINAGREAVRQEKDNELKLRTRIIYAAFGVRTLEEYSRALQRQRMHIPPVDVRLRDGRVIRIDVDTALACIQRGAGSLVWEEQQ